MALTRLSDVLWRERTLLELLLFKLEEEQLVLTSGRTRWLTRATKEVEVVLGEIRRTELARAVEVDTAAAAFGLGPNPSLNKLADACPEPWSGLLREHRKAFLTLTAEITQLADLSRELLASGQQATRETLLSLTGESQTYTPHGSTSSSVPRARLMDEVL